MADIEEQLKQLEKANSLLISNLLFLPQILDSVLSIISSSAEAKILNWCLSFVSNITNFNSVFSLHQKRESATKIIQAFLTLIEQSKSPILSSFGLQRKFITISIDLYELVISAIINNAEDSLDAWNRYSVIKKFIFSLWDFKPALETANKEDWDTIDQGSDCTDNGDSAVKHIAIKMLLLKFIFRVVEVQSNSPPKDPRKRRARAQEKPGENLGQLSLSMLDNTQLEPFKAQLADEAAGLLNSVINAMVFKKVLNSQLVSSVFFLLIKLLQKRPSFAKFVTQNLVNFDLNQKLPIETELFSLDINSQKDNFYRMKYKLDKRFAYRSYKIFLDFLFRNNFLNAFVKKEAGKDLESLNDYDRLSLGYLNKINYILQIQSQERANKNLLKDLQHDNFIPIVEQVSNARKRRFNAEPESHQQNDYHDDHNYGRNFADEHRLLQIPSHKVSYNELYKSVASPSSSLDIDVSAIPNNAILVHMILLALNKASAASLAEALEALGDNYIDVTEQANEFYGVPEEPAFSQSTLGKNLNKKIKLQQKKKKKKKKNKNKVKRDDGSADSTYVSVSSLNRQKAQNTNGVTTSAGNESDGTSDIHLEYSDTKLRESNDDDEYDPEKIDTTSATEYSNSNDSANTSGGVVNYSNHVASQKGLNFANSGEVAANSVPENGGHNAYGADDDADEDDAYDPSELPVSDDEYDPSKIANSDPGLESNEQAKSEQLYLPVFRQKYYNNAAPAQKQSKGHAVAPSQAVSHPQNEGEAKDEYDPFDLNYD